MKHSKKLLFLAVLGTFMLPLVIVGSASAKYNGDNAVPDNTVNNWRLPDDKGFCITGIKRDGTVIVDLSVGNNRSDCFAKTWPAYRTQADCLLADKLGADVEGSHFWTSTCVNPLDNTGISLRDLDRGNSAMCTQKGGVSRSQCTSQWTAMGPNWSAATVKPAKGATAPDGFCYTSMRLDNYDNVVGGSPDCPVPNGNNTYTGTGQFGYSWNTTASSCVYAYGQYGRLTSNLSWKDNTSQRSVIGGVTATAPATVDLRLLTTQGDCLAAGATWNAHTLKGGDFTEPTTAPAGTVIAKPITQVRAGCLSCHNDVTQYNNYKARWSPSSYLKHGHKNMLRKVTPGLRWAGPNDNGVLEFYTQAAATNGVPQTLDFTLGTSTGSFGTAPGTPATKPLMYLFGDWMAPAPDGLDTILWMGPTDNNARYNGSSTYSCAACHTTGWSNPTAGLCVVGGVQRPTSGNGAVATLAACTTALGTWYPMSGEQSKFGILDNTYLGTYVPQQPGASWIGNTQGILVQTDNSINGITGRWDWDGINCNRCHKVAFDVSFPPNVDNVFAPPGFTVHETDIFEGEIIVEKICFTCHNSPPITNNGVGDNGVLNVQNVDLANPKHLQVKNTAVWPSYKPEFNSHPIGNQFLGSPHGKWTGTIVPDSRGKYEAVGTLTSAFKGKVCRTSSGAVLETNVDGSTITTAEQCAVAAGVWGDEDQGSCITCHNIHQSIFEASSVEPFKRECNTCHTDKWVTSLPEKGMAHPATTGTPVQKANAAGIPAVSCELCHMPKATSAGFPMHLWRINTSATYNTFPTAAEFRGDNVAFATKRIANGSPSDNEVWVDVDYACGSCHGGGPDMDHKVYTDHTGPYANKATLALFAANMHGTNPPGGNLDPVAQFALGTPNVTGMTVTFTDNSYDPDGVLPPNAITVNWGDGSNWQDNNAGGSFTHTYTRSGVYTILLTARDAGNLYNSTSAQVTLTATLFSISGSVTDNTIAALAIPGATVTLKLNGFTKASQTTDSNGIYSFPGLSPGTYTVQVYKSGWTFDGDGTPGTAPYTNPVTVQVTNLNVLNKNFKRVSNKITVNAGVPGAYLYLKQNGVFKQSGTTAIDNTYSFDGVAPGTYTVQAVKPGVAFGPVNPQIVTVPPDNTVTFTHTP